MPVSHRQCRYTLAAVVVVGAVLFATPAHATTTVTFPVGTPVQTNWGQGTFTHVVDRDGFRFSKILGHLSINTWDTNGLHPGGLYVNQSGSDTQTYMDLLTPEPFALERIIANERDVTTGLSLILNCREFGTGVYFLIELPFDLDIFTYDTFDVAELDPRLANLDWVGIEAFTENVPEAHDPYVLDQLVVSFPTPADTPEPTAILGSGVSVWPNPSSGSVRVSYAVELKDRLRSLEIVDVTGRAVLRQPISVEAGSFEWNRRSYGASASAGIYFVRLVGGSSNATARFLLVE